MGKKEMPKKYFKILAPFTRIEDIKQLKDSGAEELYCGYITEELTKKWPLAFNILNRRGEGQSFENYNTFKKAIREARMCNLPVYVTINGLYTSEQYPLLLELAGKVESLRGVKGIIVADLVFLLMLKKNKFKKEIHISTGGTCFNSHTADYYRDLGANRIILPRQLTSDEIRHILDDIKLEIDIEIFILGEACGGFIDGFCTFFHCIEETPARKEKERDVFLRTTYDTEQSGKGCTFYFLTELAKKHFEIVNIPPYKNQKKNLRFQLKKHYSFGCRICELYDLKKYPVRSLKIVGRGQNVKYIARLVKVLSSALRYLSRNGISKRGYQQKCKNLFSKIIFKNRRRCTKSDCYLSSHWVKNGNSRK